MQTLKCAGNCFAKCFHLVGSQYVKFLSEWNECFYILKGRIYICYCRAAFFRTLGLQIVLTHMQRVQLQYLSLCVLLQIQIKGNSSKILAQMTLNATTTSVLLNNLTTGGSYTARVVAYTRVGLGPYSVPVPLVMDPAQLHQFPPR